MMSFVREKKWMGVGLSVIRRGPDNASEVCAKWRDHKMSGFGPPEVGTSRLFKRTASGAIARHQNVSTTTRLIASCSFMGVSFRLGA